ncbi:MAG: DUF4249 family protein [Flavobacteriaceae bacterium]|nr:hypothetical protein [Flavobacteriaceae bacterium]MDG2061948.1 DUF4249 family protein [Flavobacteriaceae bacterium]
MNILKYINFSVLFIFASCIDPVTPYFDFKEDLIIINAIATNVPGATNITVEKTFIEFGDYKSKPIKGCSIYLINSDTKERISFRENQDIYYVSDVFRITPGSRWEVEVILPDGEIYRSTSEKAPEKVSIENIYSEFNPEMAYDEVFGGYIPGDVIKIDFQDPVDQKNFYLFQYRAYQEEMYCRICDESILRDGNCLEEPNNPFLLNKYFTYICDERCWKITYNDEIIVFDDEFTNGKSISKLLVGRVPYETKQNILVEVINLNISENAYNYYKAIKDLVDNNSGLNAPLPTALVGNFNGITNPESNVLGRFTAGSSEIKSVFIPRKQRTVRTLGNIKLPSPEAYGDPIPNPMTYETPCEESVNRTAVLSVGKRVLFGDIETGDLDLDKDGILDQDDNCITFSNPDQVDIDSDGIGDLCDNDKDGDGYILFYENICDSNDLDANDIPLDTDLDFIPDCVDTDDDNDGYSDEYEDIAESDPLDVDSLPLDTDQDGLPDAVESRKRTDPNNPDTDGDGVKDGDDEYPRDPNRN